MKILVFQPTLVGHYLEYLHHLFLMANRDSYNEYIFVVPQDFEEKKSLFEWNITDNIVIDTLSDEEYSYALPSGHLISDSYHICKLTKSYAKKHGCKTIFSANVVTYCPLAVFFLRREYRLVGIIYKIYLYNDKKASIKQKLLDRLKYLAYSRFKPFDKLLVLNDELSAEVLNKKYDTSKFQYIPDPFVPLATKDIVDIRTKYGISSDKKVFVHFGGLSKRKGTHIVLDSISLLSEKEKKEYVFIIAGVAGDSIKNYIDKKIDELKDAASIIFENRFCEYEHLAGLCQCCTAILIPYQQTDLSSGLLGYASQFNKPVIGPNNGLIGDLISKYKLGISIDASSPKQLSEAYSQLSTRLQPNDNRDYCSINNVDNFINNINKALNNVVD